MTLLQVGCKRTCHIVFAVIILFYGEYAFAQQDSPHEITVANLMVPALAGDPLIDGDVSDKEWQDAESTFLRYVTRPFDNTAPPVETEVRFFENGTHFYIAFIAYDPDPSSIRAFIRDRDPAFGDDMVGVKLDTFGDGRLAYQFFANPYGIQTDSIENEMTGNESNRWNAIWESAGKITENGYQVEMAIPLRLMNFAEDVQGSVKKWGVEFVRFYPRSDNYRISHVPTDRDNACTLCQLGPLKGFKSAKQSNSLTLVPTAVVGAARSRDLPESREWDYQQSQEFGADITWAITPEISLQGTVNPDFSQVEADVAQLSINNTFALFFPEQRPFFVENADYFTSFQNLIYTRNINAPDYGGKITGRLDEHSLGFFVTNDDVTRFLIPGNLSSDVAEIEEKTLNMALRYRYDYSDDLSVGVVSTLRNADSYHNYVNGIDTRYRITDKDTIRAQFVHSQTQYPEDLFEDFCDDDCSQIDDLSEATLRTKRADEFSGKSYRIDYRRNTEDYFWRLGHFYTGDDFRTDLGFESRVDRQTSIIGGGYIWWNEDSWWNRIRLNGDYDISHNVKGELLEKEIEGYLSIRGNYQSFFEVGYLERTVVGLRQDDSNLNIDGNADQFNLYSASVFFDTTPNRYMRFRGFTRIGDAVDFANNRLGKQVFTNPSLRLNLGKKLRVTLQHTYSELDSNNQALFIANLSDFRMTYQLDNFQLIRFTLAYSDIKRNPENYVSEVDARSKNVGFQLLYSYTLNPLTKFFVGYSDSAFSDDDINQVTSDAQSLFMKLSYAFLL